MIGKGCPWISKLIIDQIPKKIFLPHPSVSDLLIAVIGVSMDFAASLQFGWKMGKWPCVLLGFTLTFLGKIRV